MQIRSPRAGLASKETANDEPSLDHRSRRGDSGKDEASRYLEAYFEQNDSAGKVFLHKASTMADFHQGSLDPLVLQALCALGLRQLSAAENIENIENADETMSQVEATILASMGEITLSRLQALALLLHYRRMSAKRNELWMLLSLATRMAFTLCLNHEHHDLAPVHQECNRRLMWSIYMLDTLGCAGIDSLAACPLTDIHIRLPCDEHSYAFGVASVNPRLDQAPSDLTTPSEDALAKILRLMPIRHEVLK